MHEFAAVLFDLFGTLIDETGAALEDVHRVLGAVRDARWGIVTSLGRSGAIAVIRQNAFPQPQVLICADDVTHQKPHPEGYLCAMQALGSAPEETLVVEDSEGGIQAAAAAGAVIIAVRATRSRSVLCTLKGIRELQLDAKKDGTIVFVPPS